jgi:CubicO group peptidase (beta-lactamase class C family)
MSRSPSPRRLPVIWPALVASLAVACSAPPQNATAAPTETAEAEAPVETSWTPSPEDEAFYAERYNTFVEAFRSGAATTSYDTLGPVRGAPAGQTAIPAAEAGLDPVVAKTITDYAAANNSQALIVYQAGEILHEAYFQDRDADSLIVGKSLAKPLGVVAIGRAIQEGKIGGLDQPVSDFITEWQGTDKESILIRHLLDMRSGLLPQGPAPDAENVLNRAYLHPRHIEVIIHEYPLTHEPGARYEYSNANAEMVAPIIERATGVEYEDWIADQVLMRIDAAGGEVWMNRPGGTAHAGCCMLLPARSWLNLARLVMQDGVWDGERLLPEGYTAQMTTPTPQNTHSGMGVYIGQPYIEYRGFMNPEMPFGKSFHSEPYVDDDLVLFDGNSNQVVYIIPSKELIVLRVGETPPKEPVWDNAFLPNTVSRALDSTE